MPTPRTQAATNRSLRYILFPLDRTSATAINPARAFRTPALRLMAIHTRPLDAAACSRGCRPVRPPAAQKKLRAANRKAQPHAAYAAHSASRACMLEEPRRLPPKSFVMLKLFLLMM